MLSLICCLATVGLWVRSYGAGDVMFRTDARQQGEDLRLTSFRGELGAQGVPVGQEFDRATHGPTHWIFLSIRLPGEMNAESWFVCTTTTWAIQPAGQLLGIAWSIDERAIVIPHWFAAMLFALVPAWWVLGPLRRQSKRRKLVLCLHCGYDLRASLERCPECGTAATRNG